MLQVLIRAGKLLVQFLCQDMAVDHLVRRAEDLYDAFVTIDEDYHILVSFTLQLQSIPSRKLGIRSEVAAHVAIHGNASERGDGGYDRFSAAGIRGVAAQRTKGNADLVFGIVPFSIVFHAVPHQVKVKALAPGELVDHHVAYGLFLDLFITHVYIQGSLVVAPNDGFEVILIFC